ncbi:MAG: ferric reductase-like transmembrane domain-containing protein [Chloroflexota bacterium]
MKHIRQWLGSKLSPLLNDATGQYLVHILGLLPLIIVFGFALQTLLGMATTLSFVAGAGLLADVAMIAFTAMLAMTPIAIVTGWQWPNRLRRPLALYAFAYSMIHFLIFSGGFGFAPVAIAAGAVANAMLATGTIALLGMVPLALTSNLWSMKKLGKNWKQLHYLTYPIAILIIAHLYFLGGALPWAILYAVLLGVRIPPVRRAIVNWRKRRRQAQRVALTTS